MNAMFNYLFAMFFVGNLVWLWWADRQLRRLSNGRGWRIASAVFTVGMFGALLWWILARRTDVVMDVPSLLFGLAMVWHLVVLPGALVALILWGGAWGGWKVIRRVVGRESMEAETEGVQSDAQDSNSQISNFKSEISNSRSQISNFKSEISHLESETPDQGFSNPNPTSQTADVQTATVESPERSKATTNAAGAALSRRQFLGATAAAIPPLMAIGATGAGAYQITGFRVRKLTVPVPNLPPALEGMTIAHVSDTHVGQFTRGSVLRKIADATSTLDNGNPCDLVLVTGDLINHTLDDVPAAIDMIKAMRARSGVFVVEGNHDLFEGWREFDQMLLDADVDLLLNEGRVVEVRGHPLEVLGLVWGPPHRDERLRYRGGDDDLRASLDATLRKRHSDAWPILMAHHPHALDYAAAANIPLTLAGHTHGGQLMLTKNIGPGPLMYRYWSGLYHKSNGCAGVISNGVGNWFPLRINAPAELLHLTLTSDRRTA